MPNKNKHTKYVVINVEPIIIPAHKSHNKLSLTIITPTIVLTIKDINIDANILIN